MTGIARQWLAKAREDLATVEKLLDDVGLTNIAAFHAQQCIEKCFKALIENDEKAVPRVHDLVRLAAVAAEMTDFSSDEAVLIELSTIYIDSRYPGPTGFLPSGKPDLQDIKRYHQTADEIFRLATIRITNQAPTRHLKKL